jgi:hypothetical protein
VTPAPSRPRRRGRRVVVAILALAVIGGVLGAAAVATDTLGAGQKWDSLLARVERFLAGPVPDRAAPATVRVTEPPLAEATPTPTSTAPSSRAPGGSLAPTDAPSPTVAPTPTPVREPVDVDIADDPEAVFAHEIHKDWCAVAGTQMVLALHGLVDTSDATQNEIAGRIREWESKADSRNGDWGPAAMALALDAYGAPGYEVRGFETRQGALRDAARTIQATGAPVILLAWRGAHTWVMTGFRADGDPTVFRDAHIDGAYILDPWYPWVSSIWGPSDPPGTFQDGAEMTRNFLRWRRPEGHYPDRDGLYITVAPTIAIGAAAS